MTASALIATQLTDHSARAKMLTLAGVDVIKQFGMAGNGYGVPIESVLVAEQGPGGVSTLTFDLEDPLAAGPVPSDGDEVQYWDLVNDAPLFAGFVRAWKVQPAFGNQGRITTVSCVGFEAILDWAVLTADLVIPAGTVIRDAVLVCAAVAEGTRSLRAFGGGNLNVSTQAGPVSGIYGVLVGASLPYAVTIAAGTSLRDALAAIGTAAKSVVGAGFSSQPANIQFTVDFYRGLRAMTDSLSSAWAADYVDLTVSDTLAGANAADSLEHETDATQIVRGVFVKGANAAGTGFLGDGSGKPGKVAYISDTTIDTAAKLADAQVSYLNSYVIANRGSFDLIDWTPTAGVRVGSLLALTDAQAVATGTYRIYGLTKRFQRSGRETWSIAYGGLRPSATRLIRRLTRATRS